MLYALLALLLLFILFFSLPAGVEFIRDKGVNRQKLIVFGLRFPFRWKISKDRTKMKEREEEKRDGRSEAETMPEVLQELGGEDIQAAWISLRRISRSVRLRLHKLDVHIATPDPAATGIIYGLTCAGMGAFKTPDNISVDADFTREIPMFDYRIEVSVIPGRILYESAGAAWRLALKKPRRRRMLFSAIGRKRKHV